MRVCLTFNSLQSLTLLTNSNQAFTRQEFRASGVGSLVSWGMGGQAPLSPHSAMTARAQPPRVAAVWGVYLGANSDSRHACHGASSSVKGGTPHHEIPPKHHEIQHGQECPRVETCTGGGEPHRLTESQIASKHASWSRHFRSSAASLSRTPHGTSPQPRRSAISLSLNCEGEFQAS